jgi:hypothetical protein
MHYTLYTSADNDEIYNYGSIEEYNSYKLIKYGLQKDNGEPKDKIKNKEHKKNEDIICIICWYECNNKPNELLIHYKYYATNCNCNSNIHGVCLSEWYNKTSSCPICRKLIIYDPFYTHRSKIHYKLVRCYNTLCKYTMFIMKMISFISLANICFIIIYDGYLMKIFRKIVKF